MFGLWICVTLCRGSNVFSLQERNTERKRREFPLQREVILLDEHRKIVRMNFVMPGINRMLLMPC